MGQDIPISVSISPNLVKGPIFLCKSDPHHLVTYFNGALENSALQGEAKKRSFFLDIKTTRKFKLGSISEKHTQRHNRREQADSDGCDL